MVASLDHDAAVVSALQEELKRLQGAGSTGADGPSCSCSRSPAPSCRPSSIAAALEGELRP